MYVFVSVLMLFGRFCVGFSVGDCRLNILWVGFRLCVRLW